MYMTYSLLRVGLYNACIIRRAFRVFTYLTNCQDRSQPKRSGGVPTVGDSWVSFVRDVCRDAGLCSTGSVAVAEPLY